MLNIKTDQSAKAKRLNPDVVRVFELGHFGRLAKSIVRGRKVLLIAAAIIPLWGCGGGATPVPKFSSSSSSSNSLSSSNQSSSIVSSSISSAVSSSSSIATSESSSTSSSSSQSSSLVVSSSSLSDSSSSVSLSSSSSSFNLLSGQSEYQAQCQGCHGENGEGGFFPAVNGQCNLTDCSDQAALSAYIATEMPGGSESDCEGDCAANVAAYIIEEFQGAGIEEPQTATAFQCDANAELPGDVWRRLSHTQYRNTLNDLIASRLGSGSATAILDSAWAQFDDLPQEARPQIDEDLHGTYRRIEQSVYQSHVDAWYELGLFIAEALAQEARLNTLLAASCDDINQVQNCVYDFINDFGAQVLRRPLSSEEQDFFAGFYGSFSQHSASGYQNIMAGLFNAPQFLYIIEHGQEQASGGVSAELSAYELAARLSYHFWNTLPDAELQAAAANGSLLNEQNYRAQVERLFADARTEETIRGFYREWLKLENLGQLDTENYRDDFQLFAGNNLPSSQLHRAMQTEVLDFLDYGTWQQDFNLAQFFSSQLLFPTTQELADIYGVDPQMPGVGVSAPNDARPGLLTRAGLLATRGINTRPILKGVFIRENILCDDIPAPPDNAQSDLPALAEDLTTRQQVEAITEREDTACAFCHQTLINGLGFPTENFDALGRLRDQEMLFNNSGQHIGFGSLDLLAAPRVNSGDETLVNSPAQLMDELIASEKLEACFARHYFRFSFARWETEADGCVLESLRSSLVESQSVQAMLKQVALSPAFKTKHFNPATAQ